MKYYLILFLSLYCGITLSQDTTTVYYNSDWKPVSKELAKYYGIIFQTGKKEWQAHDYYMNGQIQMTGTYLSSKKKKRTGLFTFYYENGNKESEYNYVKGKQIGKSQFWYENGNLKRIENYDSKEQKSGTWSYYLENGTICANEVYLDDQMESYTFYNEDGTEMEGDYPYEQNPEYQGGIDKLYDFLSENLKYPEEARQNKITGKVRVQFVIEKDGSISDVKVAKSLDPLLDAEAIRVVKQMPNWIPGKQHNRPVRVRFTIPIVFRLTSKTEVVPQPERF